MYTLMLIDEQEDNLLRIRVDPTTLLTLMTNGMESCSDVVENQLEGSAAAQKGLNIALAAITFITQAQLYTNLPKCLKCNRAIQQVEWNRSRGRCPDCTDKPTKDRVVNFWREDSLSYLGNDDLYSPDLMAAEAACQYGLMSGDGKPQPSVEIQAWAVETAAAWNVDATKIFLVPDPSPSDSLFSLPGTAFTEPDGEGVPVVEPEGSEETDSLSHSDPGIPPAGLV